MKTQTIRLADVFFIGPVMIYAGTKLRRTSEPTLGVTLIALGALTIWYNGKNYLEQQKRSA